MACFTGQDPEVAALTAGNAARYNALAVSEKTRDVLVSLDEIEEELKSFDFEEHRIEEGRGDQEETGKRIALEKKKRSLFVHKTGEKLLEQYAKLADWGIEKLEKNPDAAKMIDVVLLSFATYQQLMMELPERLTTGDAKRTQKAQKELDRALKSGTEAIREHLNKSGYSKEEQLVYAHAVAGPLLLLKAAVSKGKKGTSTAPSKELLTSLKDFKKVHGALKTKASQLQQNQISGRGFQVPVHDWLRIPENKKAYSVFIQGKGQVTTIPDMPLKYGITDIKNVQYISFTKQLQAQATLAKQQGTSFNLIISPKTEKISIPLETALKRSQGKIFEFNPQTQTMIERFLDGNKVVR